MQAYRDKHIPIIVHRSPTFSSIVYLRVGEKGFRLLESTTPRIVIRFPKKDGNGSANLVVKSKKAKQSVVQDDGWLETRSKGTKRKAATTKQTKLGKKTTDRKKKTKQTTSKTEKRSSSKVTKKVSNDSEIIELSSDESKPATVSTKRQPSADSDSEFEFDSDF